MHARCARFWIICLFVLYLFTSLFRIHFSIYDLSLQFPILNDCVHFVSCGSVVPPNDGYYSTSRGHPRLSSWRSIVPGWTKLGIWSPGPTSAEPGNLAQYAREQKRLRRSYLSATRSLSSPTTIPPSLSPLSVPQLASCSDLPLYVRLNASVVVSSSLVGACFLNATPPKASPILSPLPSPSACALRSSHLHLNICGPCAC